MGSGWGEMGLLKFILCAFLAIGFASSPEASAQSSPGRARSGLAKKARKARIPSPASASDGLDDGLPTFGSKYLSRRVHFAASTAPVPAEYDCTSAIEETKLREAEQEALAKCETSGESHCRVHRSLIVKRGDLACKDVPGRACRSKEFIRGCVARAIAVSGDSPESQASAIF